MSKRIADIDRASLVGRGCLTFAQAAAYLDVTGPRLTALRQAGEIWGIPTPHGWRFGEVVLVKWQKSQPKT
jgi:hypothetical protein